MISLSHRFFFTRELLKNERRFCGNAEEINFAESRENCDMRLSDREKVILLLDKRACHSQSIFSSANDWRHAQDASNSIFQSVM